MDPKPTGKLEDEASGDVIQQPELAHTRHESVETAFQDDTESDRELEATELRQLRNDSTAAPISHVLSPDEPLLRWYDPIKKIWRHQIRISVPHDDCRDHLANERTFLGYLHTSIALSMIGILTAQLWTLEHTFNPSEVFGYFILSKPLAAIFQAAAFVIALMGGVRFYRQQSAMAIGRVYASGWELMVVGAGCLVLLVTLFAVHVGISVYKSTHPGDA